jgi:hypothetical protein
MILCFEQVILRHPLRWLDTLELRVLTGVVLKGRDIGTVEDGLSSGEGVLLGTHVLRLLNVELDEVLLLFHREVVSTE